MKHTLSLIAVTALAAAFSILQTGCTGVYAVAPAPGPYVPYGVASWGGAGFYHGAYYGSTWRGNYGYAYGSRGGSAAWHNGSGSATGWRGSSASWSHGSGSASGWRGGSASWGGGSGSATGWRGNSASWSRR